MWYVNQKYNDLPLETIDEAETMPEASYLRNEYDFADQSSVYTISRTPTEDWESEDD